MNERPKPKRVALQQDNLKEVLVGLDESSFGTVVALSQEPKGSSIWMRPSEARRVAAALNDFAARCEIERAR